VFGPYAISKAEACNLVLNALPWGLDAVIALPSGVIGAYEYKLSNFGQMISDVARRKLKAYIKGEYDFVDAEDVASALADLAKKGVKGESYFITGNKITVKELVRTAAKAAGVRAPWFCAPYGLAKLFASGAEKRAVKRHDMPTFTPYSLKVLRDNCNFSHEKLTALTGYAPRPIAESLKAQVEFLRAVAQGRPYGEPEAAEEAPAPIEEEAAAPFAEETSEPAPGVSDVPFTEEAPAPAVEEAPAPAPTETNEKDTKPE
jgi:dihydroflavonol-4-reductase